MRYVYQRVEMMQGVCRCSSLPSPSRRPRGTRRTATTAWLCPSSSPAWTRSPTPDLQQAAKAPGRQTPVGGKTHGADERGCQAATGLDSRPQLDLRVQEGAVLGEWKRRGAGPQAMGRILQGEKQEGLDRCVVTSAAASSLGTSSCNVGAGLRVYRLVHACISKQLISAEPRCFSMARNEFLLFLKRYNRSQVPYLHANPAYLTPCCAAGLICAPSARKMSHLRQQLPQCL